MYYCITIPSSPVRADAAPPPGNRPRGTLSSVPTLHDRDRTSVSTRTDHFFAQMISIALLLPTRPFAYFMTFVMMHCPNF